MGPLIIAVGAMLIGAVLGLLAGYNGGAVDSGISRWVELVYAMPALLVAIVVVGVFGGGYFLAVFLLVILFSPVDTRIARGAALDQRSRPYVEAARLSIYHAGRSCTAISGRTSCRYSLAQRVPDIRVRSRFTRGPAPISGSELVRAPPIGGECCQRAGRSSLTTPPLRSRLAWRLR